MFVLGCHRSGTSLLTGVLQSALEHQDTAARAPKQATIESNIDNPEGHNESIAIVDLNERLLKITNASWNHPFLLTPDWSDLEHYITLNETRELLKPWALHKNWIDKDPRLCLTREAYYHLLLKEVPSIAIIRHPYEVANSLLARDGIHSDKALALWMVYNHHLFNSCRSLPNEALTFAYLTQHPEESAQRLCSAVASTIPLPVQAIERQLKQKLNADFLRSQQENLLSSQSPRALREACLELYTFCQQKSKSKPNCKLLANEFKRFFHDNLDELNNIFPTRKIPEANCNEIGRLKHENQQLLDILHYSRTSFRRTAVQLARSTANWLKRRRKQSP